MYVLNHNYWLTMQVILSCRWIPMVLRWKCGILTPTPPPSTTTFPLLNRYASLMSTSDLIYWKTGIPRISCSQRNSWNGWRWVLRRHPKALFAFCQVHRVWSHSFQSFCGHLDRLHQNPSTAGSRNFPQSTHLGDQHTHRDTQFWWRRVIHTGPPPSEMLLPR